jgi:zinc D-Ala-D-Ala carboxypeptidase
MPRADGTAFGTVRRREAVLAAGLGFALTACGSSTTAVPTYVPAPVVRLALTDEPLAMGQAATGVAPSNGADGPTIGGAATDTVGGFIADGKRISPFNVNDPAISQLDPLLRKAIQEAARQAKAEGVVLEITSGWRSKGFQQRLFDDAVRTYGNASAAAQYVASPEASKHVLGEAVDVGPVAADNWLIRNGAQFGLCQIYANEIWHFELVADAAGRCPPLRPNAAG